MADVKYQILTCRFFSSESCHQNLNLFFFSHFLTLPPTHYHFELFHDGGPLYMETSPLTCSANQWAGFYVTGASVMKELDQRYGKKYFQKDVCL